MTAIAFRDGVLATDSLLQSGPVRFVNVEKAFIGPARSFMAAGSGLRHDAERVFHWLAGGEQVDPPNLSDDDESTVIVVYPDGGVRMLGRGHFPSERLYPRFVCSGASQFLQGALASGASAVNAVAAACLWHDACDFPIYAYRFDRPEPEVIRRAEYLRMHPYADPEAKD